MWSEGAWRLQDHEERGIELGGGLDPLDLGLNQVRQRTIIACDLLEVVQGCALGQVRCGDDLRSFGSMCILC